MSDNEGGDSRSIGAFLLGFLTGVLVCVGIGGSFFLVMARSSRAQSLEAMRMAEEMRYEAEVQRDMAERNRQKALEALDALEKAKEAKEKDKGKKGP
jgi:hypothetical protein